MFSLVFVSRLLKGRCHGNQFKAPLMYVLLASYKCYIAKKFSELWSTNPGVYDAHLATILGAKWAKSKNRHINGLTDRREMWHGGAI